VFALGIKGNSTQFHDFGLSKRRSGNDPEPQFAASKMRLVTKLQQFVTFAMFNETSMDGITGQ
jgi:hypothetical protein